MKFVLSGRYLICRPAVECARAAPGSQQNSPGGSATASDTSPTGSSRVGPVSSSETAPVKSLATSKRLAGPVRAASQPSIDSNGVPDGSRGAPRSIEIGSNSASTNNLSSSGGGNGNCDRVSRRSTRHQNYLNRSQLHQAVELPDGYGEANIFAAETSDLGSEMCFDFAELFNFFTRDPEYNCPFYIELQLGRKIDEW